MRIFYFTTRDPKLQNDLQENCLLIGLRQLLGNSLIDWPRKKVLYHEFDESPKNELHGRGFSLFTYPLPDINTRFDPSSITEEDIIIYGVTDAYGITDYHEFNKLTPNIYYIDGHDDPRIRKTPCFKREYFQEQKGVYPIGFGIPDYQIRPINLNKIQIIQKTAPIYSLNDDDERTRYLAGQKFYIFDNELDYYNDMVQSWFSLTCAKGGWDSLRHYEIMAAGSLLCFKNYNKKPILCSPQNLPCISYSNKIELQDKLKSLINKNKPTKEYLELLFAQREWLLKNGTCKIRASQVLKTIFHE